MYESSTPELHARISSLAASLVPISVRPDGGSSGSPGKADASGSRCSDAFARFGLEESSSRTSPDSLPRRVWISTQERLLSGWFSPDWPTRGTWDSGFAYELPSWALHTDETGSSSSLPTPTARDWKGRNQRNDASCLPGAVTLLPTPGAYESTPTEEYVAESVAAGIRPDERLYLPGRKWHAQRTLSRIAPALLPTPGAWLGRRPENALADPERAASRGHEGRRGDRSVELPDAIAAEVKLLPTPTAGDSKAAGSRNLEGPKANPGVSLTDAVRYGNSTTPRSTGEPSTTPSDDGSASSGPLPGQLTLEDA